MTTEKEVEVLRLYVDERMTQRQIAYRLQTSQQNISKIIKKAQGKQPKKSIQQKRGVVSHHIKSLWSYHALHFMIYPYYFYPRYHAMRLGRGNQYIISHDWKYRLNEDSVEVMLRRGFDFLSEDKFEAIAKAEESLNRVLYEISNACGFRYEKEGRISIKLVKQHLARQNSAFAKGTAKATEKDFIQVRGIDGKVWFLIDRSKGFLEHEYVHTGRLIKDSETVEANLKDWREHPLLRLSDIAQRQEFTDDAIFRLTEQIKLHLEVMTEMKEVLKAIKKGLLSKDLNKRGVSSNTGEVK